MDGNDERQEQVNDEVFRCSSIPTTPIKRFPISSTANAGSKRPSNPYRNEGSPTEKSKRASTSRARENTKEEPQTPAKRGKSRVAKGMDRAVTPKGLEDLSQLLGDQDDEDFGVEHWPVQTAKKTPRKR